MNDLSWPKPEDPAFQKYFEATSMIDWHHPRIQERSQRLQAGNDEDSARNLFYFIRDEIRYVFRPGTDAKAFRASGILTKKRGFCTQKAILFCALARAIGMAAGLYFYDIRDHALPDSVGRLLGTRVLDHHGIAALYLKNRWTRFDATLDRFLCRENGWIPVEFNPDRDCLLPSLTSTGVPHIEYLQEYGLFAGVEADTLLRWFARAYPHLVRS